MYDEYIRAAEAVDVCYYYWKMFINIWCCVAMGNSANTFSGYCNRTQCFGSSVCQQLASQQNICETHIVDQWLMPWIYANLDFQVGNKLSSKSNANGQQQQKKRQQLLKQLSNNPKPPPSPRTKIKWFECFNKVNDTIEAKYDGPDHIMHTQNCCVYSRTVIEKERERERQSVQRPTICVRLCIVWMCLYLYVILISGII